MNTSNCVYCYKTRDTNRTAYVGRTKHKEKRDYEHRTGYKNKTIIPFDVWAHTYGWDNLYLEILEENLNGDQARLQERHWYLQLRPMMNKRLPHNTEEDRESYWRQRTNFYLETECLSAMKV